MTFGIATTGVYPIAAIPIAAIRRRATECLVRIVRHSPDEGATGASKPLNP